MNMNLKVNEIRVIGSLLEKECTTPDQYPLSINALANACNQKSNREPVMILTQSEVLNVVNDLQAQRLVSEDSSSRVSKYKHRFCNTEFSDLQLSDQEVAVICVLFLRGPQTPGELRGRTGRMASFTDVSEVDSVLQKMLAKAFVVCLPREPGKRESRYAHLFSGDFDYAQSVEQKVDNKVRIEALEYEVSVLKSEIERLNGELDRR